MPNYKILHTAVSAPGALAPFNRGEVVTVDNLGLDTDDKLRTRQLNRLKRLGAIEETNDKPTPRVDDGYDPYDDPDAPADDTPTDENGDGTIDNLESATKPELVAQADAKGIQGAASMTKAELIEALR